MKRICALVGFYCVLIACGHAAVQTITIPRQPFAVRVDCPPLGSIRQDVHGDSFTYKGSSGSFALTLFCEDPVVGKDAPAGAGLAHKDCYEFYWRLAGKNPQIRQDSVKVTHTGDYSRVEYLIEVSEKGKAVIQKHVNYYIAYQRKWIDLHIKLAGYKSSDDKLFKAFDVGLNYTDKP